MTPEQTAIQTFMVTAGQEVPVKADIPEADEVMLRIALIASEFNELIEAFAMKDLVAVADALADLKYVVEGTAVTCGLDLEPIFNEVHASNMTKFGPNGEVLRREDGKIMKPETYRRPNLEPIIETMK
jgi:hypothetical protein